MIAGWSGMILQCRRVTAMVIRVLGVFLASLLLCLCINAVAQIPDAIGIWTFDEDQMGKRQVALNDLTQHTD